MSGSSAIDETDCLAGYGKYVLCELESRLSGDTSQLGHTILQTASLACAMLVCLWAKLRKQPCDAVLLAEHGLTVDVLVGLLTLVGMVINPEGTTLARLTKIGSEINQLSLDELSPAGRA